MKKIILHFSSKKNLEYKNKDGVDKYFLFKKVFIFIYLKIETSENKHFYQLPRNFLVK